MIATVVSSIFNMAKPDAARPSIIITAVVLMIFDMTNILFVKFGGFISVELWSFFCCSFYCGNYSGMLSRTACPTHILDRLMPDQPTAPREAAKVAGRKWIARLCAGDPPCSLA